MAIRRESVVLSLEDNFTAPMERAAVATMVLERQLKSLDGKQVGASSSSRALERDVTRTDKAMQKQSVSTEATGKSIDKYSGRLKILAQALAILGPAALPIGAVAVPALTGLSSLLGAAAIAGGSAIVAFQGVGDAVKALTDYDLEPTAANLEKAQAALRELGPDAANFVLEFNKFRPVLTEIRDAAARGWFPGLTESLDSFEQLAPRVATLFEEVGRAGGDAVTLSAESLASPRWAEFISFLTAEVPSAITSLSGIVGDLGHAMAELWMSFDPGNDAFVGWLADVADGFDDWASSAQGREDIASFLDYVQQTGPAVADTFVSLVNAVAQIAQAAAPLGGPVLKGITALADVVADVADSDLGTPIMAGVLAMSLLSRATAAWGAITKTTFGGTAVASMRGAATAIGTVTTAQERASMSASALARAEAQRAGAVRSGLATLGKSAALLGGLTLATSGATDGLGLTNTATLALTGTIAGPWGAALGAGVGLVMDLASANDDLETSLRNTNEAASSGDLAGTASGLKQAGDELAKFQEKFDAPTGGPHTGSYWQSVIDTPARIKEGFLDLIGSGEVKKFTTAFNEAQMSSLTLSSSVNDLGKALGMNLGPLDQSAESTAKLQSVLDTAAPAMRALGITASDLQAAYESGGGAADELNARIVAQMQAMDSQGARAGAVADAIASIGDASLTAAAGAQALEESLDALLGPGLGVSEATDQWTAALRSLNDDLAKNNKTLQGNSDAALQNRAAIRSRVVDFKDLLVAEANAGASSSDLTRTLRQQRAALIQAGTAAGMSKGELRGYLRELGLTPKLVNTVIRADMTDAERKAERVIDQLQRIGYTRAEAKALLDAGPLTVAQAKAMALLGIVDHAKAQALIDADNSGARNAIDAARSWLAGINGDRATTYIDTVRTTYVRTVNNGAPGRTDIPLPGTNSALGDFFPALHTYATGGMDRANAHSPEFAGPGPIRMWREPETRGESYIPHANDYRRPRAKAITEATVNLFGGSVEWYANGGGRPAAAQVNFGSSGGSGGGNSGGGRSLDDQIAIVQALQSIRDLKRSLAKDGKDKLEGLRRRAAELDLRRAQKELDYAKHREQIEARTERREKAKELREERQAALTQRRDALAELGFSLDSIIPDNRPKTVLEKTQAEIDAFRASIVEAGGVWSKDLQRWSKGLTASASELDDVQAALAAETANRDALVASLEEQQRALDQLSSTMQAYSDSVAGKFLSDPFNGATTRTVDGPGPTAEQAAALASAEAQLVALRSSGTGDSVESAAAASRLAAQVASMREAAEAASQPVEETVSGLQALRETLTADTANAQSLAKALAELESRGLDTDGIYGGLYKELAASGDFATAEELASLSAQQIDEYEKLFATREDAAAMLAAQTTQAVYGAQQAQLEAALALQTAAVEASNASLSMLGSQVEVLEETTRQIGEDVARQLKPQIDAITAAIKDQPRQQSENRRKQKMGA